MQHEEMTSSFVQYTCTWLFRRADLVVILEARKCERNLHVA